MRIKTESENYYDTGNPSPRQLRVIQLAAQGFKNHEIGRELGIGEYVVRNYMSAIFDKIGVNNRVELALWYEARLHEGKLPTFQTNHSEIVGTRSRVTVSSGKGTLGFDRNVGPA
jgi:DNA-binding CsgD family transcriptional regulator